VARGAPRAIPTPDECRLVPRESGGLISRQPDRALRISTERTARQAGRAKEELSTCASHGATRAAGERTAGLRAVAQGERPDLYVDALVVVKGKKKKTKVWGSAILGSSPLLYLFRRSGGPHRGCRRERSADDERMRQLSENTTAVPQTMGTARARESLFRYNDGQDRYRPGRGPLKHPKLRQRCSAVTKSTSARSPANTPAAWVTACWLMETRRCPDIAGGYPRSIEKAK